MCLGALILLLLYAPQPSFQMSDPAGPTYIAAVVEYSPALGITMDNKDDHFRNNVAAYIRIVQRAAQFGVDILVFPECGLVTLQLPRNPDGTPAIAVEVPSPEENHIPCEDTTDSFSQELKDLSCAARDNQLYLVVNLPEREPCVSHRKQCAGCPGFDPCGSYKIDNTGPERRCPKSEAFFYNTNIAFDRSGKIVGRYRKWNLFGEIGFQTTPKVEYSTFNTDFGVRFGMFTCFDIMFEEPSVKLVEELGVTDIIFPTAWFSQMPFLTAVQTQAAWAYTMDVNFLAAGYNYPEIGSAGSGVYAGRRGIVVGTMPSNKTSTLLVATMIKKTGNSPEYLDKLLPEGFLTDISTEVFPNDVVSSSTEGISEFRRSSLQSVDSEVRRPSSKNNWTERDMRVEDEFVTMEDQSQLKEGSSLKLDENNSIGEELVSDGEVHDMTFDGEDLSSVNDFMVDDSPEISYTEEKKTNMHTCNCPGPCHCSNCPRTTGNTESIKSEDEYQIPAESDTSASKEVSNVEEMSTNTVMETFFVEGSQEPTNERNDQVETEPMEEESSQEEIQQESSFEEEQSNEFEIKQQETHNNSFSAEKAQETSPEEAPPQESVYAQIKPCLCVKEQPCESEDNLDIPPPTEDIPPPTEDIPPPTEGIPNEEAPCLQNCFGRKKTGYVRKNKVPNLAMCRAYRKEEELGTNAECEAEDSSLLDKEQKIQEPENIPEVTEFEVANDEKCRCTGDQPESEYEQQVSKTENEHISNELDISTNNETESNNSQSKMDKPFCLGGVQGIVLEKAQPDTVACNCLDSTTEPNGDDEQTEEHVDCESNSENESLDKSEGDVQDDCESTGETLNEMEVASDEVETIEETSNDTEERSECQCECLNKAQITDDVTKVCGDTNDDEPQTKSNEDVNEPDKSCSELETKELDQEEPQTIDSGEQEVIEPDFKNEQVYEDVDQIYFKADSLDGYVTFLLTSNKLLENSSVTLCHGQFCCNFSVVLYDGIEKYVPNEPPCIALKQDFQEGNPNDVKRCGTQETEPEPRDEEKTEPEPCDQEKTETEPCDQEKTEEYITADEPNEKPQGCTCVDGEENVISVEGETVIFENSDEEKSEEQITSEESSVDTRESESEISDFNEDVTETEVAIDEVSNQVEKEVEHTASETNANTETETFSSESSTEDGTETKCDYGRPTTIRRGCRKKEIDSNEQITEENTVVSDSSNQDSSELQSYSDKPDGNTNEEYNEHATEEGKISSNEGENDGLNDFQESNVEKKKKNKCRKKKAESNEVISETSSQDTNDTPSSTEGSDKVTKQCWTGDTGEPIECPQESDGSDVEVIGELQEEEKSSIEEMTPRYYYRLVAFDGQKNFDDIAYGGLQVCSIIACSDKTKASCGRHIYDSSVDLNTTIFQSVRITGNFVRNNTIHLPNTLTTNYMPLPTDIFDFNKEDISEDMVRITMESRVEDISFLTFGIYTRNFAMDDCSIEDDPCEP